MAEEPLRASGHLESFTDILTTCIKCKSEFRADLLLEDLTGRGFEGVSPEEIRKTIQQENIRCPRCGGELSAPTMFNMMFDVNIGTGAREKGYLRPETAQGAYLAFRRCFDVGRRRLPLGIAIIGKAFRNEIAPRQGVYRMREFTQAELQIFFDPDDPPRPDPDPLCKLPIVFAEDRGSGVKVYSPSEILSRPEFRPIPELFVSKMCQIQGFYTKVLNVPLEKFRFWEKSESERAFYNRIHFDVEIFTETLGGFKEVAGVHYRGDWDLGRHASHSRRPMSVNIEGKEILPHVLELSFGVDRNIWALLDLFLTMHREKDEDYIVLSLPRHVAPYQVGVFPLMKKPELVARAKEVFTLLREDFRAFYDESGSIGRRYARQDEIGTPYCITIDYETLSDDTVTIRDRDTTAQVRVKIPDLKKEIASRFKENYITDTSR
jgi:glycyl-tRNA synthetase